MNTDFDKWWNDDDLTTQGNPFTDNTPAYWAWEGWCAGVNVERKSMMQLFTDPENQPTQHGTVTVEYMQREIAAEREACAKLIEAHGPTLANGAMLAEEVRARGNT